MIELDGDVDQGVYIPPGVAHGFAALTDILLTYLVDNYYDDSDELGLAWDDPAVGRRLGDHRPDPLQAGPEQPAAQRHPRRHPAPPGAEAARRPAGTPGPAVPPRLRGAGRGVARPADPVE